MQDGSKVLLTNRASTGLYARFKKGISNVQTPARITPGENLSNASEHHSTFYQEPKSS